ncbi:MAG: hypothetical protein ACR2P0_04870 [Acidimicrobiales bacterium]
MLSHTLFLRESAAAADIPLDLGSVATGSIPNIDAGSELLTFTDAMAADAIADVAAERQALVDRVGPQGAEKAVGVAATYQMMNRLLDAVGAPVRGRTHLEPVAKALGFEPADITR